VSTREADRFEALYRRNVDAVTGFVARRCRSPEDVADVVARVFVSVIESWGRYDERRGAERPWIFGIAANCLAEHHRGVARQRALQTSLSGRRLLDGDDYERIEARIDASRLAPALEAALATLSERERLVLELVDLDGLTPREAAAAAGIAAPAARVRLARARRRVRRAVESAAAADPSNPQPEGALR
jgi:RNA polymerase sigma-70 factor (ECF subfamily)